MANNAFGVSRAPLTHEWFLQCMVSVKRFLFSPGKRIDKTSLTKNCQEKIISNGPVVALPKMHHHQKLRDVIDTVSLCIMYFHEIVEKCEHDPPLF